MFVVSLSLDPHILDPESVVASRIRRYGDVLSGYAVVVPSQTTAIVQLSDRVIVYGVSGSKPVQLWRMYKTVQTLIVANRCDVISSQDTYFLAFVGYLLAKRYHKGLEVQVLGVEKLNFLRKLLARFVLQRAGSIRVLSRRLWQYLLDTYDAPVARMSLVPIYTDVSSLGFDTTDEIGQDTRTAFKATYIDRFNVLTVSRLVPVKQLSLQLQAIEQLKETHPEVLLHIVGEGPLRASLEAEVAERGISEQVIFHGAQYGTDLATFFMTCDTFLLTSESEGWGMVIVEAALAGLPVIMSDVGCAGEVIVHEVGGLVVPVGDVAAVVAAVARYLNDPTLRTQYATAAKHTVETLPTFEQLLKNYTMSWHTAHRNSF